MLRVGVVAGGTGSLSGALKIPTAFVPVFIFALITYGVPLTPWASL